MNSPPKIVFLAVILLLVAVSAKGQTTGDMAAGLTPYQSFQGGDFDSVNLSNGNLVVHIPLVSYPQRGGKLSLDYQFIVNSKWLQVRYVCHPPSACGYQWATPLYTSYEAITDMQAASYLTSVYQLNKNEQIYEFGVLTSDGSIHPTGVNNSAGEVSMDATGFFLNGSTSTSPTVLIDRNGIRYPSLPSTVAREDPNGNQLLWNSARNVLTDTVGRTISNPAATTNFSGCAGPLAISSATFWTVPGPNGGTMQIKVCSAEVAVNIPADVAGNSAAASFSQSMVQTIVLPNNTTWIFQYSDRNSGDPSTVNYGMLTEITMPTGGTINYTYATIYSGVDTWSRWVTSRTVNANDGAGSHSYSYSYGSANSSTAYSGSTTFTDPLGNKAVHTFTNYDGNTASFYETQAQYYQGSSTLLKTVNTAYNTSACSTVNYEFPGPTNIYPTSVTTTWPNGQVSETKTTYDLKAVSNTCSYGNLLTKAEYDFGSGAPGALLRTTTNQYEAFINSTYLTNNLLGLPSSVQITDGGGTQRAYTTYGYDEYALQTSGLGSAQQLDTAPADGNQRGNRTSVHHWLNGSAAATTNCNISVTNGYLTSYATYNNTGTVYQSTDSCGSSAGDSKHTTKYSYSSTYEDAYPTTITNPLGQSTTNAYDFNTGLLTSTTDPNSQTTGFTYDNMWRIATASYPDGGAATIAHQETTFPFTATLTKKITSSANYATTNVFDGLGRISESQLTSDPSGTDYTDITYDADGRKYTVSNPYRTKTDPTYGITSYVYDGLGRTCVLIPPDGTSVTNTSCPAAQPSNDVFTTYAGSTTTVTDQQGKSRESQTDGLGRLTNVWEDPSDLNYETVYTYDALDDLATVVQGGSHNRTFVYDSLRRLTSSTNPESGTVTYTYDADSNVITKEDARSITITYAYDALNRMTGKTYSNSDPSVTYSYDQSGCLGLSACYNVGRRTGMTDAAGSESWAYDSMSRELAEQRTTNSIANTTAYTYNLDGTLAKLTYPSGTVLTYETNAAEQPTMANTSSIKYVTAASYSPAGVLSSLTADDELLTSTMYYNTRLQPCRISVKSSGIAPTSCTDTSNIGNILDYTYNFSLGTSDNGNVMGITNNVDTTRSQSFTYDHLNRILTAETASTFATSPANCWGESYTYDEWANLTAIGVASTSYNGCTQESLSVTVTNNRISSFGFGYDASGNLANVGHPMYKWNAESQLTTFLPSTTYTYDGDGRRVEKSSGTLYWYGTGNDALTETDLSGNLTYEYIFFAGKRVARRDSSNNVVYYAADHLGTSRVVASSTGTILDQSDFYPFGGERVLTASSGNTYKFTGKERDSESGLDNFGARHNSSGLGRFLSPDPINITALTNQDDPQGWNGYSYARNNPLLYTDPSGEVFQICDNGGNCQDVSDVQFGNYFQTNSAVELVGNQIYIQDSSGNFNLEGTFQQTSVDDAIGGQGSDPLGDALIGVFAGGVVNAGRAFFGGLLGTTARGTTAGVIAGETTRAGEATFQDLLRETVEDAGGQPTKSGGFAQATKDFESLAGKSQNLGKVQVKELPDGGKAVLRNFSNDGRATLEYQPASGGSKTDWIRYNP